MATPRPISRFANLELNPQTACTQQAESELKDERHYLQEAQRAFEDGRFEQGLRAYARVLEFNPQNPVAWTGQVRMLIELGEFHEAKLWADKALERFPKEPELLAAKAVALARIGDLKGALAFSDAAFEERGDTPYIWLARGDVLLSRRENRAEYCFEKARQIAPTNWFFHWLAARIFAYYDKFALALKRAQEALAADATRCVVWLELGLCQQQLGMMQLAEGSYEHALELDPSCYVAQARLNKLQDVSWSAYVKGFFRRLTFR